MEDAGTSLSGINSETLTEEHSSCGTASCTKPPKRSRFSNALFLLCIKNLAGREAIYLSSANGNGVTDSMKRLCRLPDYHEAAFEILYTPAKHSLKTNDITLFILLTTKKLHQSKRTLIYEVNCSERSLKNIYPLRIRENFSVKLKLMRMPPKILPTRHKAISEISVEEFSAMARVIYSEAGTTGAEMKAIASVMLNRLGNSAGGSDYRKPVLSMLGRIQSESPLREESYLGIRNGCSVRFSRRRQVLYYRYSKLCKTKSSYSCSF